MDETLCPCDYEEKGHIVDDELFELLVRPLPVGCRLTVLLDCCHSGSALDLAHIYNADGDEVFPTDQADEDEYEEKQKVRERKCSCN